ncbi:MAG: hypothetical protein NC453_12600 [Muribaculum sp.]|nr:hypothetical protein [Muribaculum sp.]
MAKKKHKKQQHKGTGEFIEVKVNHGVWEDYLQYGPQYDTVNDCPIIPGETEFVERMRFSKVSKDTRNMLKEYMEDAVERYWDEKRQIPITGDLKALRKVALGTLFSEFRVYLKDDKDVSVFLNNIVAPTINRLLRNERTQSK